MLKELIVWLGAIIIMLVFSQLLILGWDREQQLRFQPATQHEKDWIKNHESRN